MEDAIVTAVNFLLDLFRKLPWQWLIAGLHTVVAPLTAVHAMLYKRDSRAALGWVSVCLFFPVAGPITYFVFGINRIQTEAKRLVSNRLFHFRVGFERGTILEKPSALANALQASPFERFSRVAERLTSQSLVSGNSVQLLRNGEQAYPAMLEAIDSAQSYIYLTTYLFETNDKGIEFIEALNRAKQRGVDVKVIVDGIGEFYSLPRASKLLKSCGINVVRFLPPKLLPPTLYVNLRNHRKILVVDGLHGFTGGMNLGGRHMVSSGRKNCTADIHFAVTGPVVAQLQDAFANDWRFITKQSLANRTVASPQITATGDCYCRCITDGPSEDLDKISLSIKTAIATALQRIIILTPYFLPTREMVSVLQSAALRGVEITIILPLKSNLRFVDYATRNMLWELLRFDIQVLYQPAPFAHSKLLIIDDYYAQIGSANQDPRSLRLNFELNMEVMGRPFLADLKHYVEEICLKSQAVTLKEVDNRPIFKRIRDAFFWLFSPYL